MIKPLVHYQKILKNILKPFSRFFSTNFVANGEECGKWEFNKEEKCVYFQNAYGEIEGKVTNISKDKIILIPTTKIGKYPELEIVKFHYKPK